MCSQTQVKHVLSTFILSMQASIFSCSTAFLAWEMLAVLLLAIPSFMVLLWHQTQAQKGDTESMNITLNPKSSIPLATFLPPSPQLEKPFSATTFLFKKDPFCLRGGGGVCFTAAKLHFIWRNSSKRQQLDSQLSFDSHCSWMGFCCCWFWGHVVLICSRALKHTFRGLCCVISFDWSIYNLSRDLTVPIWLGTFAVSFSLHLLLPVAI